MIVDPTYGDLTRKLKETCNKFLLASNIKVMVRERAGVSIKNRHKVRTTQINKVPGCWKRKVSVLSV